MWPLVRGSSVVQPERDQKNGRRQTEAAKTLPARRAETVYANEA